MRVVLLRRAVTICSLVPVPLSTALRMASIGKEVGTSFELSLTFPETYTPNPDLAGQDVVFEVTVNAIEEETTPEWNDEFVQANTEYDSVDAYMEGTRTSLQEQKDSQKEYYVMQAIVDDSEFACADSDIQSLVNTKTKQ